MSKRVEGVFQDQRQLTRAVRKLAEKSVPASAIEVFVLDEEGIPTRQIQVEDEAGTLRGALWGAAAGAAAGLVLFVVISTGALGGTPTEIFQLPSIVNGLLAMASLAAAGVPLGALLGMGRWPGRKRVLERELDGGQALVVVRSEALAELAEEILTEAGATRVRSPDTE